jgi:CRP-like cAMP-binding protein
METKYDRPPGVLRPMLRAASFGSGATTLAQILTAKQQLELGSISTEIAFNRGVRIYEAGSPADFIFIVKEGVVKAFQDLPTGSERVLTFLFAGDVCGLAQDGRYVNSVKALTPTICFRIPIGALTDMFLGDSELELQFLIKVAHELREAQRQQIILTRQQAHARVAMFLRMLQLRDGKESPRIELAMSRRDIARYLGLSDEAVSRAAARLNREGIVAFPGRHVAQILDRSRFEQLALAA